MRYFADFETTVDESSSKVWLWCLMDYDRNYVTGTTIDSFMEHLSNLEGDKNKVEFFNLPFDSTYILHWLNENNFEYYGNDCILPFSYTTSIGIMGQFYAIVVKFSRVEIRFIDSRLLIGGSVKKWGEILNFPKGETPLKTNSDCDVTDSDIEYIVRDCDIVRSVKLHIRDKYDIEATTKASGAWRYFVEMKGEAWIKNHFPKFNREIAELLRFAVRGGLICYNPFYANKINFDRIWFYDFMSQYAFIMSNAFLCYGRYTYYDCYREVDSTDYMNCKEFAIYHGYFNFSLKPNRVPCLLVSGYADMPVEYAGILTITSNDLYLLKENYELEFIIKKSFVFKTKKGMFKDYIDKWIEEKKANKGEPVIYEFTKIMMNALSGKPAEKTRKLCKYPCFEDGVIKFRVYENDESPGIYSPVTAHITSIGRRMIYDRIMESGTENWVYNDTDSIATMVELKAGGNNLGDLELEAISDEWIILGKKKYFMYDLEGNVKCACVGMTKDVIKKLSIDQFVPGGTFSITKMKQVEGGRSMVETTYQLTGTKMPPDEYIRGGGPIQYNVGDDELELVEKSRTFTDIPSTVIDNLKGKCIVKTDETPAMIYLAKNNLSLVPGDRVYIRLYLNDKGIVSKIRSKID